MAPANLNSSIAMALAGMTASVDGFKPRDDGAPAGLDSFAAVAARSLPTKQHGMLPTPPNSISPSLPPVGHRTKSPTSPPPAPILVESDIDLQDALDHANSQDQPQRVQVNSEAYDSLGDIDSAGAITPGMLAKYHLPNILLSHGPLAIRHVLGYLTTSVPGFSRIPSAKARRLVVGALEGRGSGGEGGGPHSEVEFEKVGWGRWDARVRGQPPRDRQNSNTSPTDLRGLEIPGGAWRSKGRNHHSGASMAGDSAVFSHSETDFGYEDEADKMSLDDDDEESYPSSEELEMPKDIRIMNDVDLGEGDDTDAEDWAGMGAAALKARSFGSRSHSGGGLFNFRPKPHSRSSFRRIGRRTSSTSSAIAKSVPAAHTKFSFSGGVGVGDSQEREAVEALLRLGSM